MNSHRLRHRDLRDSLSSPRDCVAQSVVLYDQQQICLRVRQLTLTDFVTGISEVDLTAYSDADYADSSIFVSPLSPTEA